MTINILNGATLDFDNVVKIRSAAATGSGEVNAYVGSTLLDGSLSTGVKLLSVGTGLNPTNTLGYVEKAYIDAAGNFHAANVSGTNTGDQTTTLTGDVTGTGMNTVATTIANGVVTLAKTGGLTGPILLGRSTGGTGSAEAITLGSTLTLSGGVLSVNISSITLGTVVTGQLLPNNVYVTDTSLGPSSITFSVYAGANIGGMNVGGPSTVITATGYIRTYGLLVGSTQNTARYSPAYSETDGYIRCNDLLADNQLNAYSATVKTVMSADHFISTMTTPSDTSGSTTITQNSVKGRVQINVGIASVVVNNSFVTADSVVVVTPLTVNAGYAAVNYSTGQFTIIRSLTTNNGTFSYVVL